MKSRGTQPIVDDDELSKEIEEKKKTRKRPPLEIARNDLRDHKERGKKLKLKLRKAIARETKAAFKSHLQQTRKARTAIDIAFAGIDTKETAITREGTDEPVFSIKFKEGTFVADSDMQKFFKCIDLNLDEFTPEQVEFITRYAVFVLWEFLTTLRSQLAAENPKIISKEELEEHMP